MISPAEISNDSAGSIVMMSSMAHATTSVSLGVAASAGMAPASREQRRNRGGAEPAAGNRKRECFIGSSIRIGSTRGRRACRDGRVPRAVYTRPDSGINTWPARTRR